MTTKTQALARYASACAAPDGADWRAIADALVLHLAPKTKAPAAAPGAGEWCQYTEAQMKGRGALFFPGRMARFTFADGAQVTVQLGHRQNLAAPNWHRAARSAVGFYKAKRAHMVLRAAAQPIDDKRAAWSEANPTSAEGIVYRMAHDSRLDRDSRAMAVPEIIAALDLTRDVAADVAQCNAATADLRAEGARLEWPGTVYAFG